MGDYITLVVYGESIEDVKLTASHAKGTVELDEFEPAGTCNLCTTKRRW